MDARVTPNSTTSLLLRWRKGDAGALDELIPVVYQELRAVAARSLADERPGHTLQATELVHEAFGRLINMEIDWQDRAHFFAVAAGAMRRILVDHAKAKRRIKRGGNRIRIELNDGLAVTPEPSIDLVALDAALERLSEVDPRKGRVVELHYFGGLTFEETAVALEVSRATVKRDLKLARAWLYAKLTDGRSDAN